MASPPYQGYGSAKHRVAVSIKLERSWVVISIFCIRFRSVVGVVRTHVAFLIIVLFILLLKFHLLKSFMVLTLSFQWIYLDLLYLSVLT